MGVEQQPEYKKRVLFVGEASFLNTGFSTYYRELLPRLAATNKYEIAEFGSYASTNDPKVKSFINGRWKFYGNNPETDEEKQLFNQQDPAQPGQNTNQFGRWKFEHVLADFKPDIVIDIRDWWMVAFQERSPFRQYFKWLVMPTVDSIPQKEEWINTYNGANYVMAYSDFGIDSLRRSSPKLELRMDPPGKKGFVGLNRQPGRLHPVPLRPGVDAKTFYVRTEEEKAETRRKWGLKGDVPTVLLVQRNQARKRIAEVINAFALMKNKYSGNETIDRAVLLMHTGWPDNSMSIDYPRVIERIQRGYHGMPGGGRKGIINEVCNTFMCTDEKCGDVFVAPAIHLRRSAIIPCPKCGKQSARTPNTGHGLTREQLSEVYAMADVMIQASIAEGCGMPVQEAKACGTPVLVTDYAAIAEKGRKCEEYEHVDQENSTVHLGGETLEVAYLYEEPETTCWRAHTSLEDMADKMAKMLMDEEYRKQKSKEARECVELNYDWDKNYKEWEWILDHVSPLDRSETWDKPVKIISISKEQPPADLNDQQFVEWCYVNLLGYGNPGNIDANGLKTWMQKLMVDGQQGIPPAQSRGQIYQFFRQQAEAQNTQEMLRAGLIGKQPEEATKEQKQDDDCFQGVIL